MADPVIRIIDLWKNYGGDGSEAPALRRTAIELKKGERVEMPRSIRNGAHRIEPLGDLTQDGSESLAS